MFSAGRAKHDSVGHLLEGRCAATTSEVLETLRERAPRSVEEADVIEREGLSDFPAPLDSFLSVHNKLGNSHSLVYTRLEDWRQQYGSTAVRTLFAKRQNQRSALKLNQLANRLPIARKNRSSAVVENEEVRCDVNADFTEKLADSERFDEGLLEATPGVREEVAQSG